MESEENVDRGVEQRDRDSSPVKTASTSLSKMPDQDRQTPIETGQQDGPAQSPENDVEGMEIAPDPQDDVESVKGLPHAEPEKFAVGRAQKEQHQGAEACQQANQAIDVELRVAPEYRAPSLCLPLPNEAGIAQLHGFLESTEQLIFPPVVPHADGKADWLAGLRKIGGDGEDEVWSVSRAGLRGHGAVLADQPAVCINLIVSGDEGNPKGKRTRVAGQGNLESIPSRTGELWIPLPVPRFVAADKGPGGIVEGRFGPAEREIVARVEAHDLVKRNDLLAVISQIEALCREPSAESRDGQEDGNQTCQAGKH